MRAARVLLGLLSVVLIAVPAYAAAETTVEDFEDAFSAVAGVGDVNGGWDVWIRMDLTTDDIYVKALEVITVGQDGTCSTVATGDDVQVLPNGSSGNPPGTVCITAGLNAVIDTAEAYDSPDAWAAEVAGFSGDAQELAAVQGDRGLVMSVAQGAGDYLFTCKMNHAPYTPYTGTNGRLPGLRGLVAWGFDLTGQTAQPFADTVRWVYRKKPGSVSDAPNWSAGDQDKWVHYLERASLAAPGNVSLWLRVRNDTSTSNVRGSRAWFDDVGVTSYTPDTDNLMYNAGLEDRSPCDDDVPYGWIAGPWPTSYPNMNEGGEPHPQFFSYGTGKDFVWDFSQDNFDIAGVGKRVVDGESCLSISCDWYGYCANSDLMQVVPGLKEDTTYQLRYYMYEYNHDVWFSIGSQCGSEVIYNVTGDVYDALTRIQTSTNSCPGSACPHQQLGHKLITQTFTTGDAILGVDNERVVVGVQGGKGWHLVGHFFDMFSLTEVATGKLGGAITITNVADDGSVAPDGSITITWDTDVASDSVVEYGAWQSLGYTTGVTEVGVTAHSVNLTGLDPASDLYYRVVSDAAGYAVETSLQRRVLAPVSLPTKQGGMVVNGDFEAGFASQWTQTAIDTGPNGVNETAVERYIYAGGDGDCDSTADEVGTDDIQMEDPGANGLTVWTPVVGAGLNGVIDTPITEGDGGPTGPDWRRFAPGDGHPDFRGVIPGPNGVLDCAGAIGGDDTDDILYISTGPNGVCETAASGDDVQLIPVGQGTPAQPNVTYGHNHVLESTPGGDDRYVELELGQTPDSWYEWGYSFGEFVGYASGDPPVQIGTAANGGLFKFEEPNIVHSGDSSLGMRENVNRNGETGGLCQTVEVVPDTPYKLTAWVRGYDHYNGMALPPDEGGDPECGAHVATRLGLDPYGGSDPTAPSVVWADEVWYGKPDDVQIVADGSPANTPYAAGVRATPGWLGGNAVLDTTPAGDDVTSQMINHGGNFYLESTPAGDDVLKTNYGYLSGGVDVILAGPNNVIDTTPGGDDEIEDVVAVGPDGFCDSTASGDDLQEILVGNGLMYEPCVGPGSNGWVDTAPDSTGDDEGGGDDPLNTGPDGVCNTTVPTEAVPGQKYNDTWYEDSVTVTAETDRMTVFLAGIITIMTGTQTAMLGDLDHTVWFDDVSLTVPSATWEPAGHGWNLMSIPVEPADPDPAVVFADLAACGNLIEMSLFQYTPGVGYSIYPSTSFTAMEVGRGYWLRVTNPCNNTVLGAAPSVPQEIALANGWNMIGMPLADPVLWSGCQITDGVETKSIADAGSAGWIQTLMYYYTPTGYGSVKPDGTGSDDSLRPWLGYWLLTYQADLTLIVQ